MAEFACRVGSEGGISERLVAAPSSSLAREQLEEQGLEVFAVRRRGSVYQQLAELLGVPLSTDSESPPADGAAAQSPAGGGLFSRTHLRTNDLLLLAEELAALFRAGLPLLKCLDILRGRRAGTAAGDILDRVRHRVAGGESLSGAFALEDTNSRIPRLFVTSVSIGESSGDLEGALRRYTDHLGRAQTLRQRVRGALMYPAALFGVSLCVIGILVGFVLPRFADFYASYEAELPLPTRLLMGVTSLVQGQGQWVLIVLVVVSIAGILFSRSETGGVLRDRWVLRLPVLGHLRRLYLDVQSSRTMATLLRGGAPLTEAIAVAADGTENATYRASLRQVRDLVTQGNSLHRSMEITGLMDSLGLEMIEVGEFTGSLEVMLGHVADSYDEILERRVNTAVSLLEPAVLVSMGVFLAVVLLSLYLPLFNTAQVVG